MLSFPSFRAAFDYLANDEELSLEYADNFRGAFDDDAAGRAEFEEIARQGCCGSHEMECLVDGRLAIVGCNYGH